MNGSGRRLALTKSFVGTEDEGLVLHDRASGGASKLNAPEGRDRRPVKIVTRIEDAVAVEEKAGSVKLIASGFCDGIDHRARCSPIFCCVAGCDYREFLDSVDSEIQSGGAAWSCVGVVVDRDSVETIAVFVGAVA